MIHSLQGSPVNGRWDCDVDEDEESGDEEGPPIISKSLANLLNMEGTSLSRSCRSTQTHRKS